MQISRNGYLRAWAGVLVTALSFSSFGCADFEDSAQQSTDELQNWKVLNIQYQAQQTGYTCGPAAARNVISARQNPPAEWDLANRMGTTGDGTNSIDQVTPVLNQFLGQGVYVSRWMPNDPPTPQQKNLFWDDIRRSIDNGYGLVANIVAPPNNHPPGYPNSTIFHYIAIIGYNPDNGQVYVADSAMFGGLTNYWISFDQMATLVPPKGYAAAVGPAVGGGSCDGAKGQTQGAIDAKYRELGGCGSVLGATLTNEIPTPDGRGRYNVFERGSIYWTEQTGAHEVHGQIRDKWAELGWETAEGSMGYPITDEVKTPDGIGRYNVFERGSIYWTEQTGAHGVYGYIRDTWKRLGWEAGSLGYPTSEEYDTDDKKRRSDFQYGYVTWDPETNDVSVVLKKR